MALALFMQSLRSRADWRGGSFKRGWAAAKYTARSLWHWQLQAGWLDSIRLTPYLHEQLRLDSRLYERAQHAYINRQLPLDRRYAIIASHYRFLLTHWPKQLLTQLHEGGYSLGWLTLKDQSEVELRLAMPTGRGREGELALYLVNAQGQALSSLIFTFADDGDTLLLGCMQGAAAGLGREAVREFTRLAYGLRPKNLLLSLAYAIKAIHGSRHVLAVSNEAHPFADQPDKIKADYNGFWLECLGELDQAGFYRLPGVEPPRDIARVESKHRSTFRKRELLREQACDLVMQALAPTSTKILDVAYA